MFLTAFEDNGRVIMSINIFWGLETRSAFYGKCCLNITVNSNMNLLVQHMKFKSTSTCVKPNCAINGGAGLAYRRPAAHSGPTWRQENLNKPSPGNMRHLNSSLAGVLLGLAEFP